MTNCTKSGIMIPSNGANIAKAEKVLFCFHFNPDFNLSERDRELRQNEQLLSSGRCSIGSATFSQRTVRSSTLMPPPAAPQRHGTLRLGDPMKQVDDLKHKLRLLEEKINERDRLVRDLRRFPRRLRRCRKKAHRCTRHCRKWRALRKTRSRAGRRRWEQTSCWKCCRCGG